MVHDGALLFGIQSRMMFHCGTIADRLFTSKLLV
jgi:hypothetical protein